MRAVDPLVAFVLENSAVGTVGGRHDNRQDNQTPFLRKAGLYLGVAFELPATILAGLLVGYFLDKSLDTSPWLLITLTAAGFIGAFVRLVRWVKFFGRARDGRRIEKDDPAH
jgi:F0F1-type ATP synthase assembly protein I